MSRPADRSRGILLDRPAAVATPDDVLLAVEGLTVEVATASGPVEAVRDVGFALRRGQAIGLVGESGSGKTLTCRAVLGALPPGCAVSNGSITLDGLDLVELEEHEWRAVRSVKIGAVFQDPASYLNPSIPVGEQIAEVLRVKLGASRAEARQRAIELLAAMHLHRPSHVVQQIPAELSGGMLQRVLIATAIACEPELLIADEATTALDLTTQREVLDLLVELRERLGLAILFVSHDLAAVAELCDLIAVFYAGEVVEHGRTIDVVAGPAHPYTEALLRVGSLASTAGASLPVIPGRHPLLGETGPGCRFAPRCGHRRAPCAEPVSLGPHADGAAARCVRAEELSLSGSEL